MESLITIVVLFAAPLLCSCGTWFLTRASLNAKFSRECGALAATRDYLAKQVADLQQRLSESEHARYSAEEITVRQSERLFQQAERISEQTALITAAEQNLKEAFKALSAEALKSNSEQFTHAFSETAKALLEQLSGTSRSQVESSQKLLDHIGMAIGEKLQQVDRSVKDFEKHRISTDAELRKQLENLILVNEQVSTEAAKLTNVLTNAKVQGLWGQTKLRNVVEAAGMLEHCDFFEQVSATTEDGRVQPDMLVRLPNGLNVVIDAKAPTQSYFASLECASEKDRKAKLKEHSDALKRHVRDIQLRNYPSAFPPSLEYTVLFLPTESLFFAALEQDDELLRYAEDRRVLFTTPLSLIPFLRTVALGWTQLRVQENVEEIQQLAGELFTRVERFMSGFSKVGRGLDSIMKSYNETVGTSRMVDRCLRRFQELGVDSQAVIEEPTEIHTEIRRV